MIYIHPFPMCASIPAFRMCYHVTEMTLVQTSDMDDRRGWLVSETAKLMMAWERAESVYAIAASLGRTRMSVLVQATRLGLPPRETNAIRRKWTQEEIFILDTEYEAVKNRTKSYFDAEHLSERFGRSFDAVLAKLEKRWGSDAVSHVAPESLRKRDGGLSASAEGLARRPEGLKDSPFATESSNGARERLCLCCRKAFWSEGKHNRICLACKAKPFWD